jgi:hypothetical protein
MIRQGDYKLIVYGKNEFGGIWPPQLFQMMKDPWELHDIAGTDPANLARMMALMRTVYDVDAIDTRAKEVQKGLFKEWGNFGSPINSSSCGNYALKPSECFNGKLWMGLSRFSWNFNESETEDVFGWAGSVMAKIYGEEFNKTDAANVAAWLGEPCGTVQ